MQPSARLGGPAHLAAQQLQRLVEGLLQRHLAIWASVDENVGTRDLQKFSVGWSCLPTRE